MCIQYDSAAIGGESPLCVVIVGVGCVPREIKLSLSALILGTLYFQNSVSIIAVFSIINRAIVACQTCSF